MKTRIYAAPAVKGLSNINGQINSHLTYYGLTVERNEMGDHPRYSPSGGTMWDQCRRRWFNIHPALVVFLYLQALCP